MVIILNGNKGKSNGNQGKNPGIKYENSKNKIHKIQVEVSGEENQLYANFRSTSVCLEVVLTVRPNIIMTRSLISPYPVSIYVVVAWWATRALI